MGRHKKNQRIDPVPDFTPVNPPHVCDWEGCGQPGEYRAPKDRSLTSYYWFCLEHVKQYNAAWDYFAGMTPEEIEEFLQRDVIGHRPTWRLGDRHSPFDLFHDPFDIMKETVEDAKKAEESQKRSPAASFDAAVMRAAAVLELSFPLDEAAVRKNYKRLAKKYHPDSTGGDKSAEERFKDIAEAYRLIMTALKA